MKIWKMLILCFIIGLIAVPTVSAEKEYSENSKNKVVLDSTGEDYIVSSWIENLFDIEPIPKAILY
jgi:hypothetical protein